MKDVFFWSIGNFFVAKEIHLLIIRSLGNNSGEVRQEAQQRSPSGITLLWRLELLCKGCHLVQKCSQVQKILKSRIRFLCSATAKRPSYLKGMWHQLAWKDGQSLYVANGSMTSSPFRYYIVTRSCHNRAILMYNLSSICRTNLTLPMVLGPFSVWKIVAEPYFERSQFHTQSCWTKPSRLFSSFIAAKNVTNAMFLSKNVSC